MQHQQPVIEGSTKVRTIPTQSICDLLGWVQTQWCE